MNYYCLIAGLPDIGIEDNKLNFNLISFREEARPQLSKDDAHVIDMFFTKFDNQNLLRYLKDKEVKFDDHGNIAKDDLEEYFQLVNEDVKPNNELIPSYFATFVSEYREAQQGTANSDAAKWENRLSELYYRWGMDCKNEFIARWFEFNLNLNNILAAFTSRKYQIDIEAIGDNEVSESIKTSNQRDFGLTGIVDDFEQFQRLADEADMYEREKKIDLLKWQWLDNQTCLKYFSIEVVFTYLVKIEIIERWAGLDHEEGKKIFKNLIDSLKKDVSKNLKNEL